MTGTTMRRTAWASLAAGAALATAASAWTTAGAGGSAQRPVVLELFQSQGCSSCPPANANLNAIADRPDVLALSFGVTYWDQLGWKDSFAKPAYTDRQKAYARGLGAQLGTPQMVVEGEAAAPVIERMLADPGVAYLHAHYAKPGCYAARIDRAG